LPAIGISQTSRRWPDSNRRACGNIQTAAACGVALELQGGVGFREMAVRADLHRSVACVGHRQRYGHAIWVQG